MRDEDASAVLAIYREGIEDGLATFGGESPDWQSWDDTHCSECRLVAEDDGGVIGWAALRQVSTRECYRGVAEVSVYVAGSDRGRGVGSILLWELVHESEKAGYWTLQGTTLEENTASVRMQKRCGFLVVGVRERIGRLHGKWKPTVLTERRSEVLGADNWEATPEP